MNGARIVWGIIWIPIRLLLELFTHFKVKGLGNVEKIKTPVVAIANHASFLDPFVIGVALPYKSSLIPIRFIIKKEYDVFPLSLPAKMVGGFFVDQKRPISAKKGLKILKNKGVVGVFPEGTRTKDGKLQQFEPGAAWIAKKSSVPILPVGISGTFAKYRGPSSARVIVVLWKIGRFFLARYHITVTFGKPIKINPKEDPTQVTKLLKSKISELLNKDR